MVVTKLSRLFLTRGVIERRKERYENGRYCAGHDKPEERIEANYILERAGDDPCGHHAEP